MARAGRARQLASLAHFERVSYPSKPSITLFKTSICRGLSGCFAKRSQSRASGITVVAPLANDNPAHTVSAGRKKRGVPVREAVFRKGLLMVAGGIEHDLDAERV